MQGGTVTDVTTELVIEAREPQALIVALFIRDALRLPFLDVPPLSPSTPPLKVVEEDVRWGQQNWQDWWRSLLEVEPDSGQPRGWRPTSPPSSPATGAKLDEQVFNSAFRYAEARRREAREQREIERGHSPELEFLMGASRRFRRGKPAGPLNVSVLPVQGDVGLVAFPGHLLVSRNARANGDKYLQLLRRLTAT